MSSSSSSRSAHSVEKCFEEFNKECLLSGPNQYECMECCSRTLAQKVSEGNVEAKECKVYRDAVYQQTVVEWPPILTLQVKRFRQTPSGNSQKISAHLQMPLELDITPYCGFCCDIGKDRAPSTLPTSHHHSHQYQLYGIVKHSGGCNGGHYVAYARYNCSTVVYERPWVMFNDSQWKLVSEKEVLGQEAYLLFYERVV